MNLTPEQLRQNAAAILPELECTCQGCQGEKAFYDSEKDCIVDCETCGGTGLIPTEAGKRVLALIRHNTRLTVSATFGASV